MHLTGFFTWAQLVSDLDTILQSCTNLLMTLLLKEEQNYCKLEYKPNVWENMIYTFVKI